MVANLSNILHPWLKTLFGGHISKVFSHHLLNCDFQTVCNKLAALRKKIGGHITSDIIRHLWKGTNQKKMKNSAIPFLSHRIRSSTLITTLPWSNLKYESPETISSKSNASKSEANSALMMSSSPVCKPSFCSLHNSIRSLIDSIGIQGLQLYIVDKVTLPDPDNFALWLSLLQQAIPLKNVYHKKGNSPHFCKKAHLNASLILEVDLYRSLSIDQ